jgi:hypothetical protein
MNCSDHIESLKGSSKDDIIRILKKERNGFAESRQQWIFAAYSLKNGKAQMFEELVEKELCQKCKDFYDTNSIN